MYKILLCCAAGMSTSLLVNKMLQYCEEADIDAKIWAVPVDECKDNLPVDAILLGPQIRYAQQTVRELAGDTPVITISMRAYGRMDGETVIKEAIAAIENQ